jgi:hypothetical protein
MFKNNESLPSGIKYGIENHGDRMEKIKSSDLYQEEFDLSFPQYPNLKVPVYLVPIEYLTYRIDNGRTGSEQDQWCIDNNKEANFFKDKDNYAKKELQKAQHEILSCTDYDIADNEVYKFFKRVDQKEPLVVNGHGHILSGNRRLSMFRNLYHSQQRQNFGRVKIALWDEVDPVILRKFELHEDNVKDIKKKYSWMSQAQWYIQLKQDGMETSEIEEFSIQEATHVDLWIKRYHVAKKIDSDIKLFSNNREFVPPKKLNKMIYALDSIAKLKGVRDNIMKGPPYLERIGRLCYGTALNPSGDRSMATINSIKKFGPDIFISKIKEDNNIKSDSAFDKYISKIDNFDNIADQIFEIAASEKEKTAQAKNLQAGISAISKAKGQIVNAIIHFSKKHPDQDEKTIKRRISTLNTEINKLKKALKKNYDFDIDA